jgi:hypothetical protein
MTQMNITIAVVNEWEKAMTNRRSLELQAEALLSRADVLLRRAEKLPEPIEEPESPFVDGVINIMFRKQFRNNYNDFYYQYTAHKAADGLWYASGVRAPNGYTWDDLLVWIQDSQRYEIWLVTGMETFLSSDDA